MYADDTAMVLADYRRELPIVDTLFKDLEAAAHLSLNIDKCIFIPFLTCAQVALRSNIREICGALRDITIARTGKYLGVHDWAR